MNLRYWIFIVLIIAALLTLSETQKGGGGGGGESVGGGFGGSYRSGRGFLVVLKNIKVKNQIMVCNICYILHSLCFF
jgi:hypothetical protein